MIVNVYYYTCTNTLHLLHKLFMFSQIVVPGFVVANMVLSHRVVVFVVGNWIVLSTFANNSVTKVG